MILIKKLLLILLKLLILLVVITFEKIIGLPVIFITLLLVFMVNEQDLFQYVYLIFSSIFLSLVYGLSFSLSLLFIVLLILLIRYGENIITNDINRVLSFEFSFILIIALLSRVSLNGGVVGYFIISTFIAIVILMKTLFARHGLTGKITRRESNFFR